MRNPTVSFARSRCSGRRAVLTAMVSLLALPTGRGETNQWDSLGTNWLWDPQNTGFAQGDADPPGFKSRTATALEKPAEGTAQPWNWHAQNTDIVQYHPRFAAPYSGPNSLKDYHEVKETVSLDVLGGARLWRGAEAHADGLLWQGFGFANAHGIEAFPNGEAFKVGTELPNVNLARLFLRQTIGLGGEEERVGDAPLSLAGTEDVSRLTLTLGRLSAKDIFDNNAYANDPRTQFMNWALMANEAWDYPSDPLGYTTGFASELDLPGWAVRYGFLQIQQVSGGTALDPRFLTAWGMVTEVERRWTGRERPGAVRLLAYLNHAHMGSYQAALDGPTHPADIEATRAYRYKFGFGVNFEQALTKHVGVFARAGWSDGRTETWTFADVDRTATAGVSVNGGAWHRPHDTWGLAGALNGISPAHRRFFAAGGTGILGGDGALTYGGEQALETYYDCRVWKSIHAAVDYQFIPNPAYNRDRGPVSVLGARLHWDF